MSKAPTFTVPAPRSGGAEPPKKDPRVLPSDPLPEETPAKPEKPKAAAAEGKTKED